MVILSLAVQLANGGLWLRRRLSRRLADREHASGAIKVRRLHKAAEG